MKHTSIMWFLILCALITSCGRQQGSGSEEPVIPVEVTKVQKGNLEKTLTFSGDIKAELQVKVFSKVSDRIEQYFVDEGDLVRKGDPIATIQATTIEQALRQAEAGFAAARAQYANTKAEYDRATRLYNENAISRQQFDAVTAQYEAVSAQLEQAEAVNETAKSRLDDATVTSPIDGLIGVRYFDAGDMAVPATPIASVVQMDNVKIEFDATEEDLGSLAVGQVAEVRVRSYTDTSYKGNILRISPVLDPMTRMATVEVLIPNEDHALKPGMYAEAEITVGMIKDTIVIPRGSVLESTSLRQIGMERKVVKNYHVYVVNDSSRAEQRVIETAYVNHSSVAVETGLDLGERLVISGQNNLRDGMAVMIPSEDPDSDSDNGSGEEA